MTDAEWVLHVKYEKIYTLSFIKFLDYGIKYYKCQWWVIWLHIFHQMHTYSVYKLFAFITYQQT